MSLNVNVNVSAKVVMAAATKAAKAARSVLSAVVKRVAKVGVRGNNNNNSNKKNVEVKTAMIPSETSSSSASSCADEVASDVPTVTEIEVPTVVVVENEEVQHQPEEVASVVVVETPPAVIAVVADDGLSTLERELRIVYLKLQAKMATSNFTPANGVAAWVVEEYLHAKHNQTPKEEESIPAIELVDAEDDATEMNTIIIEDAQPEEYVPTEQPCSIAMTIAVGVLSRRIDLETSSVLDVSAMSDVDFDEAVTAAPTRVRKLNLPTWCTPANAANMPTMNCDIASYALQKSSLVDFARAKMVVVEEEKEDGEWN